MLSVAGLRARYGPLEALHDIAFTAQRGEAVAILGANGAGKTTLMRALTGTITLDGQRIERRPPEQQVQSGLALAPERRELFGSLTVCENLLMGALTRRDRRALEADIAHPGLLPASARPLERASRQLEWRRRADALHWPRADVASTGAAAQ